MSYASLISALALVIAASAERKPNNIIVAHDGIVENYFGVPVSINLKGVPLLRFKHRRSILDIGEGSTARAEIIRGAMGWNSSSYSMYKVNCWKSQPSLPRRRIRKVSRWARLLRTSKQPGRAANCIIVGA